MQCEFVFHRNITINNTEAELFSSNSPSLDLILDIYILSFEILQKNISIYRIYKLYVLNQISGNYCKQSVTYEPGIRETSYLNSLYMIKFSYI